MRQIPTIIVSLAALILIGAACTKDNSAANSAGATNQNTNAANSNTDAAASDPAGTIVVEASTGTLTATDPQSFIAVAGNSGVIAYLAGQGDVAKYSFVAPKGGQYQLHAMLSDDGTFKDGVRNATIVINPSPTSGGGATIKYLHSSRDTKGWVWQTLGNVSLNAGTNTISFTKDEYTGAAFSFQRFKFTPMLLAQ